MIVHFKESSSPSPGLASWQRLWSTVQRPRGQVSWTYGTPQAIYWLGGAGGLRIQNGDGGAWADMKPNSTPALMLLHSDTETHGKPTLSWVTWLSRKNRHRRAHNAFGSIKVLGSLRPQLPLRVRRA